MQPGKLAAWPRFGIEAVPVKDLYRDKAGLERINSCESEWKTIGASLSTLRRTKSDD